MGAELPTIVLLSTLNDAEPEAMPPPWTAALLLAISELTIVLRVASLIRVSK
jgi:hypothetical protein